MDGAYVDPTPGGPSLRRGRSPSATPLDLGDHPAVVRYVADARRRDDVVVLEGVHAFKHATRFGADVEVLVSPDLGEVRELLADLAPDVHLPADRCVELDPGSWGALVPRGLPSPLLAVAGRPDVDAATVLAAPGRVVVLEGPRHLGNLGAVVRVAAAAEAGGVLVVGDAEPWHPTAVRAAAGLTFALPVARCDQLPVTDRPIVALDPEGDEGADERVPSDALVLVGTERGGLSPGLLARADVRVSLPMRPGVSSLNLATAVAAALYAWR